MRRFPTARKVVMFLGDVILIGLSYVGTVFLLLGKELTLGEVGRDTGIFLLLLVLTILLLHVHGLYNVRHKKHTEITLGIISLSIWEMFLVGVLTFFLLEEEYPQLHL